MAITKEINILVKESGMDKVDKSISNLENSIKETETATKNFKTQIREANQELLKMSQKFGDTSKEAVQAAKKVADLKDQMEFANDLVKTFNPDQKFKALGASTQLAGTGLQGVTAGMALFGDQSKDTEKALLQVQSAMAFADALSNLSNLGDQWKTLKTAITGNSVATKINNVATMGAVAVTKLFGGAVDGTSKGFKVLKGAIIATGIGALVVGVGMLIANFDEIKKVVLRFIPELEKVGQTIMGIVNAVTDFIGLTSEADRAISKQKEHAEKSLKQTDKYLLLNEHKITEAQKRDIELRKEHFQRVADGEVTQAQSVKIYKEKMAQDEAERQKVANEKALEAHKQARDKANQAREQADQKAKAKAKENSDKEIEILKEKFENEKTTFEEQRKFILSNTKITADEKAKLIKEIDKAERVAIEKNNEDVLNLKNEYKRKIEDLDAKTEIEKIELEEQRALEELDRLKNNEEAKLELTEYYKKVKADLDLKDKEEKEEKALEQLEIDAENEDLLFEERLAKLDEQEKMVNESVILNAEDKAKRILEIEKNRTELQKTFNQLLSDQQMQLANNIFAIGGALAKKGSKLAKGIAIGQATMNTYQGVTKALAETTDPTPTQAFRFANAAAVGIMGAINIAKIVSAKEDGASGGGGGGGGGAPAQPQAPSFNLIQGTGRNQIAETLQGQAPLRAFVVARDVTTGQSMDRNIINSASI